ncbi:hypothetical protein EJ110_NYTH55527, partial [Nymphaea thermarum]
APPLSPPQNRTCEFPRIRLKWLAKALSFALGKRFAVAKLTASLSARAKLRPRLLVASGFSSTTRFYRFRGEFARIAKRGLLVLLRSPEGKAHWPAWKQATESFWRLASTPGPPPIVGSRQAPCRLSHPELGSEGLTPWQQEKAIWCYTPVISCPPRHENSHRVPDHIP